VDVEFAHDVLAMSFHGADAKAQLAGDVLVAETFGNQRQPNFLEK
jgi:hypothetical protein